MLPPLRATVPSPSPSSISHRSCCSCSTLRSSSVCSSCAVFRLKRTKPPSLKTSCNRCSCSLHRNLLSPSVSHPESTVAPRTCAPNHGEQPCACPSPPALGLSPSSNFAKSANTDDSALFSVTTRWRFNKSSHTTFSANRPSCCLSHVLPCAGSLMNFSAPATLVETSLFIIMSLLSETFFFVPSSFMLISSSRA